MTHFTNRPSEMTANAVSRFLFMLGLRGVGDGAALRHPAHDLDPPHVEHDLCAGIRRIGGRECLPATDPLFCPLRHGSRRLYPVGAMGGGARSEAAKQRATYARVCASLAECGIDLDRLKAMSRAYWTKGGLGREPSDDRYRDLLALLVRAHRAAHALLDSRACGALMTSSMQIREHEAAGCSADDPGVRGLVLLAEEVNRRSQSAKLAALASLDPTMPELDRRDVLETMLAVLEEHRERRVRLAHLPEGVQVPEGFVKPLTQKDVAFALLATRRILELADGAEPGTAFPIDPDEILRAHRRLKADVAEGRRDRIIRDVRGNRS